MAHDFPFEANPVGTNPENVKLVSEFLIRP
jgi:hypothetical protein